jgi:hypothetical protein
VRPRPVHGRRGGVEERNVPFDGPAQQSLGILHVVAEEVALVPLGGVGARAEVRDGLDIEGRRAARLEAPDELVLVHGVVDTAGQATLGGRARKLVDDQDVTPSGHERGDQVATDEAGAARDRDHLRESPAPRGLKRLNVRVTGLQ